MNSTEAKARIRRLTRAQRQAFNQLCSGVSDISPKMLQVLHTAGLVSPTVPTFVHIAWAEICSEEARAVKLVARTLRGQ